MSKHRAVSHSRWQYAQKKELDRWRGKNLAEARQAAEAKYLPVILPLTQNLTEEAHILEIGCGAVCLTQALPQKNKTYLDPLMDDLRRMFPGELSEGEFLSSTAESIHKESGSFDLIVCLNSLSHTLNPELMLNEVKRLLSKQGLFLLSVCIHSGLEARLHYLADRMLPVLCHGSCPYFYSLTGIRNTLKRHFDIRDDIIIEEKRGWLPAFARQEHLFVCSLPNQRPGQPNSPANDSASAESPQTPVPPNTSHP